MKKIAHRGNTNGPQPTFENTLEYMISAWSEGYDIECDLIAHKGILYFGHDEPQQPADTEFIQRNGVWCHAKNFEALVLLSEMKTHYFWHENDNLTITSKSFIWCFPGIHIKHKNAIWLNLHNKSLPNDLNGIYGVCSDKFSSI